MSYHVSVNHHDTLHVISWTRPSCFSACNIENLGMGLGKRLQYLTFELATATFCVICIHTVNKKKICPNLYAGTGSLFRSLPVAPDLLSSYHMYLLYTCYSKQVWPCKHNHRCSKGEIKGHRDYVHICIMIHLTLLCMHILLEQTIKPCNTDAKARSKRQSTTVMSTTPALMNLKVKLMDKQLPKLACPPTCTKLIANLVNQLSECISDF